MKSSPWALARDEAVPPARACQRDRPVPTPVRTSYRGHGTCSWAMQRVATARSGDDGRTLQGISMSETTQAGPKAGGDKQADKPSGALAEIVEIIKTIVYALAIALFLRVIFFQPYTIPSASMEPNLYEGDYIIV